MGPGGTPSTLCSCPVSETFLVEGTFLRSSLLWRGFLRATLGVGQGAGATEEGIWRASQKIWAFRASTHWGQHRVFWCRGLSSATGYLLGSLGLFEYQQSFVVLEGRTRGLEVSERDETHRPPRQAFAEPSVVFWLLLGGNDGLQIPLTPSVWRTCVLTAWLATVKAWKVGKTFMSYHILHKWNHTFYITLIFLFKCFGDLRKLLHSTSPHSFSFF